MQQLTGAGLDQGPLLLAPERIYAIRKQAYARVLGLLSRRIDQPLKTASKQSRAKVRVCAIRSL